MRIHSQVALITNSSTVIYTHATTRTVKTAKALINAILLHAGADQTCDDLFVIELGLKPKLYDEGPDSAREIVMTTVGGDPINLQSIIDSVYSEECEQ